MSRYDCEMQRLGAYPNEEGKQPPDLPCGIVTDLRDLLAAALEVIEAVEWNGWAYNQWGGFAANRCPECGAHYEEGHNADCKLADVKRRLGKDGG